MEFFTSDVGTRRGAARHDPGRGRPRSPPTRSASGWPRSWNRFFTLSLDLFCVASFDGYFIRLNPAWQQVLGYTEAGAAGGAVPGLRPSRHRERTETTLSALVLGEHISDSRTAT
jgi:PAS domain-containing protein